MTYWEAEAGQLPHCIASSCPVRAQGKMNKLGMELSDFKRSTQEEEAGITLSSRLAWSTQGVPGLPGLQRESLFSNKQKPTTQQPTNKKQNCELQRF